MAELFPPDLFSLQALIALVTLTALEIVLGIDNIVFIAILAGRLPRAEQPAARRLGLMLAMVMRVLLLIGVTWVMRLTTPLFSFWEHPFSGRDLILLGGGLFLMAKATHEIHAQIEGAGESQAQAGQGAARFWPVVAQIGLIDIIFSLDSVITAVGMANQLIVMILAVVIAVAIMIVFSGAVSRFVERHPTMRMLALAFLILIGVMLTAEGLGQHIDRGYVYFAMAFSLGVEVLNLRARRKAEGAAEKGGE
ncbi:MAG: TerC family protein [Thermodesulfobacteriota bacterium]